MNQDNNTAPQERAIALPPLNIAAQIISFLSHPVFMPLAGVLVILNQLPYYEVLPEDNLFRVLQTVAILTVFIPMLIIGLMYLLKMLKSITLSSQRSRYFPLIIISIALYFTYSFFKDYQIFSFISVYLLACSAASIAATIINFFWKISLHSIGLGGLFGLLAILNNAFESPSQNLIFILIVVTGIVGSARLYLQEHSVWQYLGGFFIGLLSMFGVFAAFLV